MASVVWTDHQGHPKYQDDPKFDAMNIEKRVAEEAQKYIEENANGGTRQVAKESYLLAASLEDMYASGQYFHGEAQVEPLSTAVEATKDARDNVIELNRSRGYIDTSGMTADHARAEFARNAVASTLMVFWCACGLTGMSRARATKKVFSGPDASLGKEAVKEWDIFKGALHEECLRYFKKERKVDKESGDGRINIQGKEKEDRLICRKCNIIIRESIIKCPKCGSKLFNERHGYNKGKKKSKYKEKELNLNNKGVDEGRFVCQECRVVVRGDLESCPKCGRELKNEELEEREGKEHSSSPGPKEFKCPSCSRVRITGDDAQSIQCSVCGSEMHPVSEDADRTSVSKDTGRSSETSGDCFVATSVYGDPGHSDVCHLRRFRDETLRRSVLGRIFIAWYYRYGPDLAEYIKDTLFLKRGIRWALRRLVGVLEGDDS